jgi:nucleoside-triphosphatase THEP1
MELSDKLNELIDNIKNCEPKTLASYDVVKFSELLKVIQPILSQEDVRKFVFKYLENHSKCKHITILDQIGQLDLLSNKIDNYLEHSKTQDDYKIFLDVIIKQKKNICIRQTRKLNLYMLLFALEKLQVKTILSETYLNTGLLSLLLNIFYIFNNDKLKPYLALMFRLYSNCISATHSQLPVRIRRKHSTNIIDSIITNMTPISIGYLNGYEIEYYVSYSNTTYRYEQLAGINIINYGTTDMIVNLDIYTPMLCYIFLKIIRIKYEYTWHDGIEHGDMTDINTSLQINNSFTRPSNYIYGVVTPVDVTNYKKIHYKNTIKAELVNHIRLCFVIKSNSKLHLVHLNMEGDILFL